MKRDLVVALSAVILAAGMAGCSKDEKPSGPASPSSATSSATAAGPATAVPAATPAAAGETRVLIGGQPQPASGPVVCQTNQGRFSIAIGDMVTGVIVGLEEDGSAVRNAGLGTVDGVVLSFTEGAPGNSATATKTGKAYHISGTATGVDNAGQQISKSFEVDATCP